MKTNNTAPDYTCPFCHAPEQDELTPVTLYACGTRVADDGSASSNVCKRTMVCRYLSSQAADVAMRSGPQSVRTTVTLDHVTMARLAVLAALSPQKTTTSGLIRAAVANFYNAAVSSRSAS